MCKACDASGVTAVTVLAARQPYAELQEDGKPDAGVRTSGLQFSTSVDSNARPQNPRVDDD